MSGRTRQRSSEDDDETAGGLLCDEGVHSEEEGKNYFLAYWSNEGFEALEDITRYENWDHVTLLETIKQSKKVDRPNPLWQMIGHMKMRMRFNPQREYELYAFMSTSSVTHDDLVEWMDRDPQSLVDWIRKNGVVIASDKNHMLATRIKIT